MSWCWRGERVRHFSWRKQAALLISSPPVVASSHASCCCSSIHVASSLLCGQAMVKGERERGGGDLPGLRTLVNLLVRERWKTVKDLPRSKRVDLLARWGGGWPLRIFLRRGPRHIFCRQTVSEDPEGLQLRTYQDWDGGGSKTQILLEVDLFGRWPVRFREFSLNESARENAAFYLASLPSVALWKWSIIPCLDVSCTF